MKKICLIILFIGVILFSSCTSQKSADLQESSVSVNLNTSTLEAVSENQEAEKIISLSDFQGK